MWRSSAPCLPHQSRRPGSSPIRMGSSCWKPSDGSHGSPMAPIGSHCVRLGGLFEGSKPNGSETVGPLMETVPRGTCFSIPMADGPSWVGRDARGDAPPSYDVFHYLVQWNQELLPPTRRHREEPERERLDRESHQAYANGAGISAQSAEPFFRHTSMRAAPPSTRSRLSELRG
jgi:hypothetical protein